MQVGRTTRATGGQDWHFSAVALHYSGLQYLGKLQPRFSPSLKWTMVITLILPSLGGPYGFWKTLSKNGIWGC